MMFSASEGAAQILAADVLGPSQKSNPAVNAVSDAVLQLGVGRDGVGLQDRLQSCLILPDERFGLIVLMPIGSK